MMRDGTGGSAAGAGAPCAPWSGTSVPNARSDDAGVAGCDPRILLMAFSTRLMIRPRRVPSVVNQLHQPPLRDQQYRTGEYQHRRRRGERQQATPLLRAVILGASFAYP